MTYAEKIIEQQLNLQEDKQIEGFYPELPKKKTKKPTFKNSLQ